jgi:hypothetical protein
MARNRVQFQKGLGLADFNVRFCNGPLVVNPFFASFHCWGLASVRGQR